MKAIHVLRKPCSESTVAGNVLTHGCGGLNIDAARIRWTSAADSESAASTGTSFAKSRAAVVHPHDDVYGRDSRDGSESYTPAGSGRWPANLVLQHLDGCRQTGVRGDSLKRAAPEYNPAVQQGKRASLNGIGNIRGDAWYSTEVNTPVYECAHGCPVAALDAQSGVLKSGALPANQYATEHAGRSMFAGAGVWENKAYGANEGGASRFFKQVP